MSPPPSNPELFHIVHVNRLDSIINLGNLYSDAKVQTMGLTGAHIGMPAIKTRRLTSQLSSHQGLCVGDCVPFYFCPRSIMLYTIHKRSQNIPFNGGQDDIIHLRFDMHQCVQWAKNNGLRWAFTDSNAGSYSFNDYNSLNHLNQINWQAIAARQWSTHPTRSQKQAEFLIESNVDFQNVLEIGVKTKNVYTQVTNLLTNSGFTPNVMIQPNWYY